MGARGVAAGLLALAAGCDDEDGNRNVPNAGSFQPYVDAFCQAARNCCGRSSYGSQELADCEAEFERQTGLGALLARGNVTIEPAAFEACVAAHRRSATECVTSAELERLCTARIFRGSLPEGAACDSAIECWDGQGDWVCLKASNAEIGVCRRTPGGRSGEACSRDCADDPCLSTWTTFEADPVLSACLASDGLFCSNSGSNSVCAPFLAEGAACTPGNTCGPDQYCDGVCTRRKAQNEVCASFSECAQMLTCLDGRCAVPPVATQKLCSGDLD